MKVQGGRMVPAGGTGVIMSDGERQALMAARQSIIAATDALKKLQTQASAAGSSRAAQYQRALNGLIQANEATDRARSMNGR